MIDKTKLAHASKFYTDEHGEGRIDISMAEYERLTTPPTQEEVCRQLSEDIKQKVYYNEKSHEFMWEEFGQIFYVTETYGDGKYTIADVYVSAKSITLIGRFYQGVKENG